MHELNRAPSPDLRVRPVDSGVRSLMAVMRIAADGLSDQGALISALEIQVGASLGGVTTFELWLDTRPGPSPVAGSAAALDSAAPQPEGEARGSALVVPMQTRGRTIGKMRTFRARTAAPFDAQDHAIAQSLADHAALAITSAREHLERIGRAEQAQSLAAVAREFCEVSDDLPSLLHLIATRMAELGDAFCVVSMVPEGGSEAFPIAFHGLDPYASNTIKGRLFGHNDLFRDPLVRRVHETGEAVLFSVLRPDGPFAFTSECNQQFSASLGIHSLIIVPLGTGIRVIGVLILARYRAEAKSFDSGDVEFAEQLAMRAALVIESARSNAAERAARAVIDRANEALRVFESARSSESLFEGFVEAAPDAVVITTLDGTMALVNAQTEKLFGYIREELIGKSIELLVPNCMARPSQAPPSRSRSGARATRPPSSVELMGRRKDGSEFYSEVTSSSLETEEEVFISRAIRDISDRRQVEVEQARLASIVSYSDDAIISKTLDGIVTTWNDGARRIFGYTAEEMIGRPIAVLVPPGREDEEPRILERLKRGERVEILDTIRRRRDGIEIHVSLTSSPLYNSKGHLIGASKVARDITERHLAEEALARAKDAAEAASGELEAFSYSVAHDLRAPLRGMNGFASLLLDTYGDQLDDEGRDWLHEIVTNAQKMGSLIDALLELARVTRLEPKRTRVDLSAVASSVLEDLAAEEPTRRADVIIAPGLTAVVDPVLARVLLENLLRNAWKFTSKKTPASLEFGRRGASLFVRDNGAGFDMAFADKLFKPFQRLHAATQYPGTGIGLATVQRIVTRHGGRIWAESEVERGATFYFSFPEKSRGSSP